MTGGIPEAKMNNICTGQEVIKVNAERFRSLISVLLRFEPLAEPLSMFESLQSTFALWAKLLKNEPCLQDTALHMLM